MQEREVRSGYLEAYQNVPEARTGTGAYTGFYNEERPHQALGFRTLGEVFEEGCVNTTLRLRFLRPPERPNDADGLHGVFVG